MKITCIVVAAGKGKRIKAGIDKVFILVNKKPILFYTLKNLEKVKEIQEIILVVSRRCLNYTQNKFFKKFKFTKIKKVVVGGKTRSESVWQGLKAVERDSELVLIHDGARPFLDLGSLKRLIKASERFGAAVLAIPATSTVKIVKNFRVIKTLERKFLWEVQTPQIFRKNLLIDCYQKARRENFPATDDAQIVERYGHRVEVVEGSPLNIKITSPQDLRIARAIIRCKV